MSQLRTVFLRVAKAGDTIDGREISEQDLRDMAETYDREVYTANINHEHMRWFASYGQVDQLRIEEDNDAVYLAASLIPNKYLLQLNDNGQKLFTSIEIAPNFAKTGKAYLAGLAVTDNPASLGTTQLNFSKRLDKDEKSGAWHAFVIEMENEPEPDEALSMMKKMFSQLFSTHKKTDKDKDMEDKQFNELKDFMEKQGQQLENLESRFNQMGQDNEGDGDGNATDGDDSGGMDAAAFSAQFEELSKKLLGDVDKKLNDFAKQEVPGTDGGEDEGDADELVL